MSNQELKKKSQFLVLKAYHGDSLILKTFDSNDQPFNIVIDGGTSKTFNNFLKNELKSLSSIDILILTHIDSDHISGLIKYINHISFNKDKIKRYWFNSKNIAFLSLSENISYNQAKTFEELLLSKGEIATKWSEDILLNTRPKLPPGIKVEILSPTQEVIEKLYKDWPEQINEFYKALSDVLISSISPSQILKGELEELAKEEFKPQKTILEDIFNSSSIAFVFETFDMKVLLLGDSHPDLILSSLISKGYSKMNKLNVDFVKISHHGSKNNTSNDLLDLIECDKFIISTNGGTSSHRLPDRETIARIIHHPERVIDKYPSERKIYLNYPQSTIETKAGKLIEQDDFLKGNWKLIENTNIFECD